MRRPSKLRIRQSFERAAASYDAAAVVQRTICVQLLADLPAAAPPHTLLDAGCGTGFALGLLQTRFPDARACAVDLSPAMLARIPFNCDRLAGDLEQLPLADACIDLFWSSLSVQWCDLQQSLREARRVLRPNGQLALATLGPATFRELRLAFSDVDSHEHTLDFVSMAAVEQAARASGFAAVDLKNQVETVYYPDLRSLLHAVKAIGANQLGAGRRRGLLSRQGLQQAEAAFEQLRTAEGLPLSYDVIRLYARP